MKSRMPSDYQIPDDPDAGRMDSAYLRSCFGLRTKPGEEPMSLPLAVRRAYYDMARSLSILGESSLTMTPTQLAMVAVVALRDPDMSLARQEQEEEHPEYSFLPEVEAGRVTTGQKVVVHWRRKDQAAHFIGQAGDRLVLLLNGNEFKFRPGLVRWPQDGEFPEVSDNINEQVEA